MDHVFRGFLAVLVILLLLQLVVNILISTGRPSTWSLSLSAAVTPVDGQLVTGDSRRRVPSKSPSPSDRPLGFWSLFGRDAFAYLSMLLQGKPFPLCPEVPSNLGESALHNSNKWMEQFANYNVGPWWWWWWWWWWGWWFIHSFLPNIYIAPLQERLLIRGAPNSSGAKKNSLQKREERER